MEPALSFDHKRTESGSPPSTVVVVYYEKMGSFWSDLYATQYALIGLRDWSENEGYIYLAARGYNGQEHCQ